MPATPPRFHRLTVADVRREAPDAVSIAFAVPEALAADYAFAPGQYLTLRRDGDGARRSYSVVSGPGDGELRIGVKRVEGGSLSTWLTGGVAPGDAMDVMTPTGRFGVALDPSRARVHVGFAAGSGITPILSIARGVLAGEPDSRFFLFYGSRAASHILFRGALEELKDRHLTRLSMFHVLSREEQDLPVLNGRIDGDKVRTVLRSVVPASSVDHVFICGPSAMGAEVEAACLGLGLAPDRVHVERFVSAHDGAARARQAAPAAEAPSRALAALVVDGKRRTVPIADGETVLDAALRAGLDLPYACKGGMCSTCRARVVDGEAAMALNYSLEPWEVRAGFVLTCQAHPVTDRVTVDFDAV